MNLTLNGEKYVTEKAVSVAELLKTYMQKEPNGIAIARNGVIVPRSKWELTHIEENDEIEIVHAVQGG